MQCAWTNEKNEINVRRHGIPFAVAIEALDDPLALTKEDYMDDDGEMRY
ncbi:MAG: BrnT family toxin [Bryobacteraceae bacterium]